MRAPRLLPVVAVLATIALVAGCGGDDDTGGVSAPGTSGGGTSTTNSTVDASTTTTVPESTTTTVPFAGSTSPTSQPPPAGSTGVALLGAVRTAHQATVDRVVFEFTADQLPGFDVAYADGPPTASGSGDVVAVEGEAVLLVRLEPASGVDLDDPGARPTYTGPDRVTGDTTVVTEVVRTGDFEANLEWAIGLRREVPFLVSVLRDPSRIVIDLAAA